MKKILFFAFFCCAFFSYAQKADLKNCYKYSEENLKKYYHSLSVFPSWISGTDMFWYNYITPGGAKYYLVDPVRKKKLEMFDMEDMIGKLTQATGISFNIKDFRLGGLKFDERIACFLVTHIIDVPAFDFVSRLYLCRKLD